MDGSEDEGLNLGLGIELSPLFTPILWAQKQAGRISLSAWQCPWASWGLPRSMLGQGGPGEWLGLDQTEWPSCLILIRFHSQSQLPSCSGRPQRAMGRGSSNTPRMGQLPSPAFGKGGSHKERITGNHPGTATAGKWGLDPHACHFPALISPPLLTAPGPWPQRVEHT